MKVYLYYLSTFPIAFVLLLTSCTNIKVHSSYSTGQDFTPYKTYAILASSQGDTASLYNDPDIKYAFENYMRDEMEYRGYVADSMLPDLAIDYHTKIFYGKKRVIIPLKTAPGMLYPENYFNQPGEKLYTFDQPYTSRGTVQFLEREIVVAKEVLVIKILDRKEEEVIWEGQGLEQTKDKKELFGEVPWSVKKLLRKYPVKYQKLKK